METNIPTQNQFNIFIECLLNDTDNLDTPKENNKPQKYPSTLNHKKGKTSPNLRTWKHRLCQIA